MATAPTGRPRGRPKGSVNRKDAAIVAAAEAEGIMPLAVLLEAMRAYHASGNVDAAVEVAKAAAPYCHAKKAAPASDAPSGDPTQLEVVERVIRRREEAVDLPALPEASPVP